MWLIQYPQLKLIRLLQRLMLNVQKPIHQYKPKQVLILLRNYQARHKLPLPDLMIHIFLFLQGHFAKSLMIHNNVQTDHF